MTLSSSWLTAINYLIHYFFDFDSYILVMNRENASFIWKDFNTNLDPCRSVSSISFLRRKEFCRTTITIYCCILQRVFDACIVFLPDALFGFTGSFCNCLLPESIQISAVRHLPDHPAYSGMFLNISSCVWIMHSSLGSGFLFGVSMT